ncbi:hypothetical protein ACAN107058_18995 [Paracidovorax anthurii]|uniref:Uncharacterized protein n=1 Tax=Paracidovorax anthurii TaxID=78229 RepID=A0A328ZI23_9BURK|nr:hypothetical protein AX018_1005120 [Paracidovorax anthurii]
MTLASIAFPLCWMGEFGGAPPKGASPSRACHQPVEHDGCSAIARCLLVPCIIQPPIGADHSARDEDVDRRQVSAHMTLVLRAPQGFFDEHENPALTALMVADIVQHGKSCEKTVVDLHHVREFMHDANQIAVGCSGEPPGNLGEILFQHRKVQLATVGEIAMDRPARRASALGNRFKRHIATCLAHHHSSCSDQARAVLNRVRTRPANAFAFRWIRESRHGSVQPSGCGASQRSAMRAAWDGSCARVIVSNTPERMLSGSLPIVAFDPWRSGLNPVHGPARGAKHVLQPEQPGTTTSGRTNYRLIRRS